MSDSNSNSNSNSNSKKTRLSNKGDSRPPIIPAHIWRDIFSFSREEPSITREVRDYPQIFGEGTAVQNISEIVRRAIPTEVEIKFDRFLNNPDDFIVNYADLVQAAFDKDFPKIFEYIINAHAQRISLSEDKELLIDLGNNEVFSLKLNSVRKSRYTTLGRLLEFVVQHPVSTFSDDDLMYLLTEIVPLDIKMFSDTFEVFQRPQAQFLIRFNVLRKLPDDEKYRKLSNREKIDLLKVIVTVLLESNLNNFGNIFWVLFMKNSLWEQIPDGIRTHMLRTFLRYGLMEYRNPGGNRTDPANIKFSNRGKANMDPRMLQFFLDWD